MMPVSGVSTGAAQRLTAAEKALGTPKEQKPGEKTRGRPLAPSMDEYIPEEKREPSGRYWMGKDENGQRKIYFDSPEIAEDGPRQPEEPPDVKKAEEEDPDMKEPERNQGAKAPKKKEEKEEVCAGNTDKVDREIERLKKEKQELEQRIDTETNESKIKDLERRLAQVERELREKDNDTYRKKHSTFTQLG